MKDSGFSLMELLVVLAAIGLALAWLVPQLSSAQRSVQNQTILSMASDLSNNIARHYGVQRDYRDVTIRNIIAAGLIDPRYVNGATSAQHPGGGAMQVNYWGGGGGNYRVPATGDFDGFYIRLLSLSSEQCVAIATHADAFAMVFINAATPARSLGEPPISAAVAAGFCNQSGNRNWLALSAA